MRKSVLILCYTLICAYPIQAQKSTVIHSIEIKFDGSAPPVPLIYACAGELKGHPYSEADAKKCLDQMLANGHFISGDTTTQPLSNDSIRLQFHLTAPALEIVELEYELDKPERDGLEAFLRKNNVAFQVGDVYDAAAQGMALQGIQQFFASKGRREGITSKTELDYQAHTARIHFRFYEGPTAPKESKLLVELSGCNDEVQELNLTDIDDYVPLPLVEDQMKVRAFSCFDQSLVREDEQTLQRTGLFRSVKFHVSGPQGARRVVVQIDGKPLTVSRVNVVGYGSGQHGVIHNVGELPLRANSVYKASSALKAADYLAGLYGVTTNKVNVLQDVRQVGRDSVDVTFSVLVYGSDELYIDGKLVHPAD